MAGREGFSLPLSPARRWLCDLMAAAAEVPTVTFARTMRLGELYSVLAAHPHPRPSWVMMFAKAFGLVAYRRPELRRSFLKYPTERLYQHAESTATVMIERDLHGEPIVIPVLIRRPENRSLADLTAALRTARTEPLTANGSTRRLLRYAGWPRPLRRLIWHFGLHWSGRRRERYFGTFGLSTTAHLGASALTLRSPLTSTIHYGSFDASGTLEVRLTFDHRVIDGAPIARALAELESTLLTVILPEVQAGCQPVNRLEGLTAVES